MAINSYIQFSPAADAPRLFVRNILTVEFQTVDGNLYALVRMANRDDRVTALVTIGQAAADQLCADAGLLPFNPAIGFFNPYNITHYSISSDGLKTHLSWLSNKDETYQATALNALYSWSPSGGGGVFELSVDGGVQQVDVGASADIYGFAQGESAFAGPAAISLGFGSQSAQESVAIGYLSNAQPGSVALGVSASAESFSSFAGGQQAQCDGMESVAIGREAIIPFTGERSIAIGAAAQTESAYSVALGYDAYINSPGNTGNLALGYESRIGAGVSRGIAIGTEATVQFGANRAVAIGEATTANHDDSVVFQERVSTRENCVFMRALDIANGHDIYIGSSTGTRIGQGTSRIGFFGATPITQQLTSADFEPGDTLADTQNKLQQIVSVLKQFGFIDTI